MTSLNVKDLPDDIDALKEIISQASKVIGQKDKENQKQESDIQKQKFHIEKLELQLERFRRHEYGARSEKHHVDPGQMELFKKELPKYVKDPDLEEIEEIDEPKKTPRRIKPSQKMDLDEVIVEHTLPENEAICDDCESTLKPFAQDVSEELVYIRSKVIVKKHTRQKYVCPQCEGSIKIAPKPLQIIPKSSAGASVLAYFAMSKYADHLPLNRLGKMMDRWGINFPVSTTSHWMMVCAELLEPITKYMLAELLQSKSIHTDDTTIPVMAKKKTKTGRLWVYLGDEDYPYVYFQYSPDRKGERTQSVLENYSGYIHADAYPGYKKIFSDKRFNQEGKRVPAATEVACNAHARRKFEELYDQDPSFIEKVLWYYSEVYKVERNIKKASAEERKKMRQKMAKPILKKFYEYLEETLGVIEPNSNLRTAINYAVKNKKAMCEYLNDGDLHIDNNPAERVLRCAAIGRKNWMFAGSDRGGKAAAVFYSLIETCKLHDVNPYTYLNDALIAMADSRERGDPNHMEIFTPLMWKQTRRNVEKDFQENS